MYTCLLLFSGGEGGGGGKGCLPSAIIERGTIQYKDKGNSLIAYNASILSSHFATMIM